MNFNYNKHKKIIILLMYAVLTVAVAYLLIVKAIPLLAPFVIAMIFAFLINPIVDFFNYRLKINRKVSSLLVILMIFVILSSIIVVTASEIYYIIEGFVTRFISNANVDSLSIVSDRINKMFGLEIDLLNTMKNLVLPIAQGSLAIIKSIASNIPQAFIASVVFILTTYILIVDKEKIFNFITKLIGKKNVIWINEIRKISKNSIMGYVKAQLILMSITFSELLIGFTLINIFGLADIKYAFLFAFLIALLDALPVFGTGAVLIPWSLYNVLLTRFDLAIALFALYIVCIVVRQFIEPKIVGVSLGLHPLVTLFSMYLGLKLIGIGGMILLPVITIFVIQLYKAGAFDKIKEMIQED